MSYFIVEAIVGASAAKAAKNSERLTGLVDTLDSSGKLRRAARAYRYARNLPTTTAGKGLYQLGKGVSKGTSHTTATARRVLSQVPTSGRQYAVGQKLRGVDPGFVDGLSNAKQRTLGRWYARTDGIDTGRGIATDGGRDVLDLFERMPDVNTKTIKRIDSLKDRDIISNNDIGRLVRAKRQGSINGNELRRITKLLDPKESEYIVGKEVGVEEVLEVAQENSDLGNTLVIANRDGKVQWVEIGKDSDGWIHIMKRHGSDFRGNSDLGIESSTDIKRTILQTIEEGDSYDIPKKDKGGTVYLNSYNDEPVSVIVGSNGYVVTSHPGIAKQAKI